jgi:prepilin peptidase CpaA
MFGPFGSVLTVSALAGAGLVLVYAAVSDVATRTIPNWTSLAILSVGLLLRAADRQLWIALPFAAVLFIFTALLWRFGALGGGDVKLLVATSTIIPFPQVIYFVPMVGLAGGALALVYILIEKSAGLWGRTAIAVYLGHRFPAANQPGILPYGTAIAAGAFVCLAWP